MSAEPRISSLRAAMNLEQLRDALHHGSGKGVRVAVIDSGVDGAHPAFAGKIASHHDVIGGYSGARCEPAAPTDSIGHGTATAGIILEIAPECELNTIKVIGEDSHGTAEQLIAALSFAIDEKFDVINMSWARRALAARPNCKASPIARSTRGASSSPPRTISGRRPIPRISPR